MNWMSLTAETISAYRHRGYQLWKRAAENYGRRPSSLAPKEFVNFLLTILPPLKPSSRRQYLASAREWLNHLKCIQSKKENTLAFNESINFLSQYSSGDFSYTKKVVPRRGNTSSQKSRRFKVEDYNQLVDAIKETKSKWTVKSLVWIRANMIVGLRPIEWKNAYLEFIKGERFLVVVNAKNTNNRSHGKLRHLNLTRIDDTDWIFVKMQIEMASLHNKDAASWSSYYNAIRCNIHDICRATFPNRRKFPTLYSTRHQFAANAKSANFTKCEIAALMGHATDKTATMHYGRKKHGSGSFAVKPVSNEVSRIRVISKQKISKKPKM
jgi:integrase